MKIAVIGAGLAGLASAWFLRADGHDVTVLERRSGPALETSFANAGMLTPSQAEPWNEPGILRKVLGWLGHEDAPVLLRPSALPGMLYWGWQFLRNSSPERYAASIRANATLARYSLDGLRSLRQAQALDYGQICAGTLKVYRDPRAMEGGRLAADVLGSMGVVLSHLDSHGAVALEPALADIRDRIVGAIHFPGDESGDAHRFCAALATALERNGVQLHYGVEVTSLVRDGSRVRSLSTSTGPVGADAFVLCAGSYSPALGRMLGLDLPIRPVKGYSISVPMQAGVPAPRIAIVDDTRHAAVTPMDGVLRVAGTAEFAGFDTTLQPARLRNLEDVIAEVLPRHRPGPGVDTRPWAGLRPYCCDGVPIIAATAAGNVFVNAGHGHLGWTLAVGSGGLLAALVSRRTPDIDPAPYRLGRF